MGVNEVKIVSGKARVEEVGLEMLLGGCYCGADSCMKSMRVSSNLVHSY